MPDLLCRQLVHPPHRTSLHLCVGTSENGQQWEVGAETLGRHGGMAWMVMKAALVYATCPRTTLLHARTVNVHYKYNTVHSRLPLANKSWRDCGKDNSPGQPLILGCNNNDVSIRPWFNRAASTRVKVGRGSFRELFFCLDDITGTLSSSPYGVEEHRQTPC